MLPFYGRKYLRKTNKSNVDNLKNFKFFFDETNFRKTKNNLSKFNRNINLEIGFGKGENLIFFDKTCSLNIFFCN